MEQCIKSHATWSRGFLKKLIVAHVVKKFSAFYVIRRFIIMFSRVLYWTLSWARWIQSTHSHPISKRFVV